MWKEQEPMWIFLKLMMKEVDEREDIHKEAGTFCRPTPACKTSAAARSLAYVTRGPSLRKEDSWTNRSSSDKARKLVSLTSRFPIETKGFLMILDKRKWPKRKEGMGAQWRSGPHTLYMKAEQLRAHFKSHCTNASVWETEEELRIHEWCRAMILAGLEGVNEIVHIISVLHWVETGSV